MKVLLIDDKAEQGWKQLLVKIFPINGLEIITATNYSDAITKIKNEFDLIFLDIRLDATDHKKTKVEDFSGYKILKEIKSNFLNENFSTPIFLLTASNKIWNIDAFRNYGVDAYYIKEHPNYILGKETSKLNYENLKQDFDSLIQISPKRKEVWTISKHIIEKISEHNYFNGANKNQNVKNRIIDKLKLGYSYLFKEQTQLEKDILKTNNESLAFVIYWSILEEIVKGFSDINETWNSVSYERKTNWKFKNKEYFIEQLSNGDLRVNISKGYKGYWELGVIDYKPDMHVYKKYLGLINLSEQVYALLAAYSDEVKFKQLSLSFSKINKFRNQTDYIHSDVRSIFEKELIRDKELINSYQSSRKILSFIGDILNLI